MKDEFIKEIANTVMNISEMDIAEGFLKNMFTESEIEELYIRLQIFKKLKKGMPHRKIASHLGISVGTVSRGSKEFKYNYTKFLELL